MKRVEHPWQLLFVALSLGLAWAVRGHFGHEWGAGWAGAIAAAAVVVVAGRPDWSRRLPVLAALGGLGWAVGGIMSYGLLVGFGRGTDFLNVGYGLAMLGVVGGLYGFIGGGFLGLGLETSDQRRPDWPRLLTEMVAGAWLAWGLLIYQLEWFMTPPRSELWAACLGAAVALAWYLYRQEFRRALRVSGYAALGAGFGFAFGNFLQTLGHLSGLAFNWWNVMEFSLGFFGGLGMSYGVFTRNWLRSVEPRPFANGLALVFLLLALPATNLIQTFGTERFIEMAESLSIADPAAFARAQILVGWVLVGLAFGLGLWAWTRQKAWFVPFFFFLYSLLYVVESQVQKGFWVGMGGLQLPQVGYLVVLSVLGMLWWRHRTYASTKPVVEPRETWKTWAAYLGVVAVIIVLMTAASLVLHDGIPGMQERF